ncbi:transglycosylase SLT domain-containing protein [Streptomyces sp. NBC_01260]|uniref:LysM peptidoglycan-binding domain-containing protein n=1 Tax=unclassified Streptomyces TaxID=2593676 RepID=UPI000F46748B|nr:MULTISPECIES: LysM peptidoglycan-binding domain-containing protein [unclassified Streptomyces]MCX4774364.1 transglycosylase SLT domain-containing protein [Streptomyces sp. NBC_01285]ROQ73156.1 LysM domain-containing protein [Streptomyces sp. CEV 2-1]RPK35998.1 Transglycosylase SLT domain protein [Streptomyces sp. ADI92-24]
MPIMGKNRRSKSTSLTRGFIAVSTGGVVLALPLIGAGSASAAPAHSVVAEKSAASTSVAAKEIAVRKAESTVYSVVSGDSLSKIAQGHSLSGGWERLYQDNRSAIGGNPDLIYPGLKLTIGAKSAAVAPKAAPAAESKAKPATESKPTADASQSSDRAAGTDRADRSQRTATPLAEETAATAPAQAATAYTDDLDGWIKESLAVMAQHGIPGSYDGIYRNVIRESSGNPQIVNNWDSNAAAGTPSKGLLQVIQPTFEAYHVAGTSMDILDPVANITAACNYAAATYGSIDNVFGAY